MSATIQNPWDFELSEGLSGLIPLTNPQDFAEIVIGGNTKYSPQDIEALKDDTLSFTSGKDRVIFVWNENGLVLNSNWATQPASSYFYISDVIAAGTNASGFKKYALTGTFQCLTTSSNLSNTQALNQGKFAILVVETTP